MPVSPSIKKSPLLPRRSPSPGVRKSPRAPSGGDAAPRKRIPMAAFDDMNTSVRSAPLQTARLCSDGCSCLLRWVDSGVHVGWRRRCVLSRGRALTPYSYLLHVAQVTCVLLPVIHCFENSDDANSKRGMSRFT